MPPRHGDEPQGPYVPAGPNPLVCEIFDGINTSTTRVGVKNEQMYWCDGFMPIGPNLLRTLYGIGPALWTAPATTSVEWFDFANIGAVPYMIAFTANGAIYAVRTDTQAATLIAAAGTIDDPSRTNVGISQYGSQYVIIVADQDNGYFLWDGVNFFQTGSLSAIVNLISVGAGYTTAPTVTPYGGSGSGASFVATVANGYVTGVSVVNPGTGYIATDVVGVRFQGGGHSATTAILTTTVANGTIATISITQPGFGYTTLASLAFAGGGGFGAAGTITVTNTTISAVGMTNRGANYTSAPTVLVLNAASAVAQAYADIMPFGVQGTMVETYAGRVWVGNGPDITFSAPGSVVDFSTSNGGGNFTASDSFLRVGYVDLRATNGFLYLIADSSVNYISGVQTSGTPATTTFTNQNADPEVGTPYPGTVDTFGRNIVFANSYGAHISYGAAVTKISEELDGVFSTVPEFDGFQPSAAKAIIFGKKVWVLLIPIIDPITSVQVNKLFMWNGKKWWASGQDVSLIYLQHQEIDSVLTAWGTDGASVYPLFQQPSIAFQKILQSKLWSVGGFHLKKAATRFWGLAQYYSATGGSVNVSIDNEFGIAPIDQQITLGPAAVVWTTTAGDVMAWTTTGGSVMNWFISGVNFFNPTAVGQTGQLLGFTMYTNAADMGLISAMIQPEITGYMG